MILFCTSHMLLHDTDSMPVARAQSCGHPWRTPVHQWVQAGQLSGRRPQACRRAWIIGI